MPTQVSKSPSKSEQIEQIQNRLFLLDCKDRWSDADWRLKDELHQELRRLS